jgi:hypothetical protein
MFGALMGVCLAASLLDRVVRRYRPGLKPRVSLELVADFDIHRRAIALRISAATALSGMSVPL